MFFSIIINTHNQKKILIERAINSCLNQNFSTKDYEIIVSDTSDQKNLLNHNSNPRVKIIEAKKFSDFPCVDQMLSIKNATNYSRGKNICLLDGDDFFSPNKLKVLQECFINHDGFLNQDNIIGYSESNNIKFPLKNNIFYKNNYFYKKLFNKWPLVLGTSSICISSKYLQEFFLTINSLEWNYLAIDALLLIYFQKKNCLYTYGNNLTYKSFHDKNLDNSFSNRLSKKFWTRRKQQHEYFQKVNGVNYKNLDYILSKLFAENDSNRILKQR